MRDTSRIAGRATAEATAARRDDAGTGAAPGHYRTGANGLVLSSVGLGTYLGDEDDTSDALYAEAVLAAIALGCNVIDTAINYRCQRSERVIGRVVASAVSQGRIRRDEIVIATKGGYLPFDGRVPADPQEYIEETYVDTGIIDRRELVAGCHCIAPGYLADQLDRSLANLGIECVDIYYLHNPETQLQEISRDEFRTRMRAAFTFLEQQVDAGRIASYGIATWNGLRRPRHAREHLPLAELVRLAEEIRPGGHHFRFVQLPYNLAMAEARTLKAQAFNGERLSTLDAAHHLGITVIASAAILQGQLTRLPRDFAAAFPGLGTDAQRAIQFARSTPGITTALVGMRGRRHVEENLALARVPPDPEAAEGLLGRAA
jgi:aryl-alcohol dehydrogenase-like predicted oxidoreductase